MDLLVGSNGANNQPVVFNIIFNEDDLMGSFDLQLHPYPACNWRASWRALPSFISPVCCNPYTELSIQHRVAIQAMVVIWSRD